MQPNHLATESIEAEQSTLGSMMLETDALMAGIEILRADDFYRPVHQDIFSALEALSVRNEPADLITLQEELRKRGKLDDVGGTEYLMTLVDTVPTAWNIEYYARIVLDKSGRRQAISAATAVIAAANDPDQNPGELLVEKSLALRDTGAARMKAMPEVVGAVWDRLVGYANDKPRRGISWGIERLDRLTYGVCPSEFVLIGGRPSEGKTVLLTQLAINAARQGVNVLLYSQEMTAEDIGERAVFMESGIDSQPVRNGVIADSQWEILAHIAGVMKNMPITINDLPATITSIVSSAKRAILRKKIGLILVDYLQIVKFTGRASNRNEEVEKIAGYLQDLAHTTGVPVVAATQVNRANLKREDKLPQLGDLRDGGNQEAQADKVILIHNPPPTEESEADEAQPQRKALLLVAKHRGGRTGRSTVWFNPGCTRFTDCEEHYEEPNGSNRRYEPARPYYAD